MEEKKQIRWWIGKVALFVEQIRDWHFGKRGKRIWWHGGGRQGAVPATQNLKLIAPVHGIELKKFFEKELEATARCFGNMPFFPSLVIIVAEIEAIRREQERRKAEKYARFMQYFKSNKDD